MDMYTTVRPRSRIAQDDPTPVKYRALSRCIDAVQIRLDGTHPESWRYRRLMLQRRALEHLAGCPRLDGHGRRV
jgi:hypothetical protein